MRRPRPQTRREGSGPKTRSQDCKPLAEHLVRTLQPLCLKFSNNIHFLSQSSAFQKFLKIHRKKIVHNPVPSTRDNPINCLLSLHVFFYSQEHTCVFSFFYKNVALLQTLWFFFSLWINSKHSSKWNTLYTIITLPLMTPWYSLEWMFNCLLIIGHWLFLQFLSIITVLQWEDLQGFFLFLHTFIFILFLRFFIVLTTAPQKM